MYRIGRYYRGDTGAPLKKWGTPADVSAVLRTRLEDKYGIPWESVKLALVAWEDGDPTSYGFDQVAPVNYGAQFDTDRLIFDGSNDRIEIPDSPAVTDKVTQIVSFTPTSNKFPESLWGISGVYDTGSNNRAYGLYWKYQGLRWVVSKNGTYTSAYVKQANYAILPTVGQNYKITTSYDGQNAVIYHDGIEKGRNNYGTATGNIYNCFNATPYVLGCHLNSGSPYRHAPIELSHSLVLSCILDDDVHAELINNLDELYQPQPVRSRSILDENLAQNQAVTLADIVAPAPVVDPLTVRQDHAAQLSDIEMAAPDILAAYLVQNHVARPAAAESGAPAIPSPAITQDHVAHLADIETGAPAIPALPVTSSAENTAVSLADIETGAPALDKPIIKQDHVTRLAQITAAAPELSAALVTQNQVVNPANIETGAPSVPALTVTSSAANHSVSLADVTTGAPNLSKPIVGQDHRTQVAPVLSGAPNLDKPVVRQNHVVPLDSIETGAPLVPALPVFDKLVNTYVALSDVTTGAPSMDGLQVRQDHVVSLPKAVTGAPYMVVGQVITMPDTPLKRCLVTWGEDREIRVEPENRTVAVREERREITL